VAFLQVIAPEELDVLEDRLHIFVFARGQCLAKEGEVVDYVGVIAEGRAVGKGTAFEVGDVIGHTAVLGYEHTHSRTITAESDGVVVALRTIDLLSIDRPALKNRILSYLVEVYASQVAGR
jgi:signal-transduction protein with cAMP-binding, CBS, and nucleotidyltransferase domain